MLTGYTTAINTILDEIVAEADRRGGLAKVADVGTALGLRDACSPNGQNKGWGFGFFLTKLHLEGRARIISIGHPKYIVTPDHKMYNEDSASDWYNIPFGGSQ